MADLFNPTPEHRSLRELVRSFSEREVDPLAEGGRGLPILDGYGERLILANRGREVTVWLRVAAEEATS